MKTLMYPAIALMNRLSFAMKFGLMSMLFFLPMLGTNVYLVSDSYHQYMATQIELKSLDLLGTSLNLRRDLEALSNLAEINAVLGPSGKNDDLESRIATLEQQVMSTLQRLTAVSLDNDQIATFNAKRDQMVKEFKAQQTAPSLQNKSLLIERMLADAQLFCRIIASQAGLSQDDEPEVRQLIDLVNTVTPQVTSLLGQGRSMGTYSLAQNILNTTANVKFDILLNALDKLDADYGLRLDEAMLASPGANQQLQALASTSRTSLKQGAMLFEKNVVMADPLEMPWHQFYDQTSELMAQTYGLNEATLHVLDDELRDRLAQKRNSMLTLSAALALMFVTIFYLYAAFYIATRSTLGSLRQMMDKVATGDMTVSFHAQSRDELGDLGLAFNTTVQKIHDLIEKVGSTVGEVQLQAGQVETVSAQSSVAVTDQRGQIEQVAAAMNQMTETAQEVAHSAVAAVASARNVNLETASGRGLLDSQQESITRLAEEIERSVAVINQLANDSASISTVLDVIKSIAEQTNLLALNAAIEAARAGEQGRGFAVVADEVRTLAQRTRQSTDEIQQTIKVLQNGVGAAVTAMGLSHHTANGAVGQSGQVQKALVNILDAVGQIVDQNQRIATAAEQQMTVAQNIDRNIIAINQAGERTASGAHQTERASGQLTVQIAELKHLIGAFRV
ncbi:MAG: methyl-accepting chemotaxis protein [Pseudomonas sp.]|jgi:methyl-accepting chemotaxis protein|uniref:methyl-accepting chemotaxis protein n=1 Tax=Pseudomonas sp. TaxID=306 RepID=UPI00260A497D|nr:methyl-accepting chemotaxis protein [Pseudomonas sp.]MDB6049600.1 methyl-accepting chemotaxis protein [Pseudomonas sp.]